MVGWLKRLFFQQQEEPVAVTGIKYNRGELNLAVRSNRGKLYSGKISKDVNDEYLLVSDCYDIVGIAEFVWEFPIEELMEVGQRLAVLALKERSLRLKMGKHASRNKKPDPKYVQKYRKALDEVAEEKKQASHKWAKLYHEIVEEGNK